MHRHVVWAVLLLGTTAAAQEGPPEVLPTPAPLPPALVKPGEPRCPEVRSDLAELRRNLQLLKAEREALDAEATATARQAAAGPAPRSADEAKLRLHLSELLLRLGTRGQPAKPAPQPPPAGPAPAPKAGPNPAPAPPAAPPGAGPKEVGPAAAAPPAGATPPGNAAAAGPGRPLDPLALAQALFRAGSYEASLRAYRMISLSGMKAEERAPVQYMMATCLRSLGKTDEAAALYREVANSRGDEQVAACAQWQLTLLHWRRDLTARLQDLRQRRQALEANP